MNQAFHSIRLFLCIFSGEDKLIIRRCNRSIQIAFALIGVFVIAVFCGCFFSALMFVSHIFKGARWVSVPVGLIWAILVTLLYLLMLYTISPPLLPVRKQGHGKKTVVSEETLRHPLLDFSMLFRLFLIALLAIIITQPFNVFIFAPSFAAADFYTREIKEILSTQKLSWLITLLGCGIFLLPVYLKYQVRAISKKNYVKEFTGNSQSPAIIALRKAMTEPGSFRQFSQDILRVDINSIRTSDFYFLKTLLEYRVILEHYQQFKSNWEHTLDNKVQQGYQQLRGALEPFFRRLEKANPAAAANLRLSMEEDLRTEKIVRYEHWADPPFNSKSMAAGATYLSESDLITSFYTQPDQDGA